MRDSSAYLLVIALQVSISYTTGLCPMSTRLQPRTMLESSYAFTLASEAMFHVYC